MIPRIDGLDRNFIINGAFDFAQRDIALQNLTGAAAYVSVDRFLLEHTGAFVGTKDGGRFEDSPSSLTKYCLLLRGDANADGKLHAKQRIESIFAKELGDTKSSLGFWVKTDGFDNLDVVISSADVEDDFSTVTQISTQTFPMTTDSTWRFISIEDMALPASSSRGLEIEFIAKDTNNVGVLVDLRLSQIKLNIGTKAQNFSYAGRDLVEELQLCQRYFEKSYSVEVSVGSVTEEGRDSRVANSNGAVYASYYFKIKKRILPVSLFYSPATGTAGVAHRSTAGDIATSPVSIGEDRFSMSQGSMPQTERHSVHWTADAEL